MTPLEQIKGNLDAIISLQVGCLKKARETDLICIYADKALALVNQMIEGQNIPADRQGAVEALDSLVDMVRTNMPKANECYNTIRAALAEPQVKPLEWVDYEEVTPRAYCEAKTIIGLYKIERRPINIGGWLLRLPNGGVFAVATKEAGLLEAEAHWQSKVREVLS